MSAGRVYLLVGSDSREELTPEERAELGTGAAEGQRTDTIMLLHIPTDGRPALISVPRDSVVEIPGHGEERINAAFAFGGAPLLVETLENATGVAIDEAVRLTKRYSTDEAGAFVNGVLGGIVRAEQEEAEQEGRGDD